MENDEIFKKPGIDKTEVTQVIQYVEKHYETVETYDTESKENPADSTFVYTHENGIEFDPYPHN